MNDMPRLVKENQIQVSLAVSPEVTMEDLIYLYHRGILDWTSFGTYALAQNNLDSSELAHKTDPWSKKDVQSVLLKQKVETAAATSKPEQQPTNPKPETGSSDGDDSKKRKSISGESSTPSETGKSNSDEASKTAGGGGGGGESGNKKKKQKK